MIRMGKSSKQREPENEVQQTTGEPAVSLQEDPQPGGAFSESERMARDIKEGRLSGFVGGGTVLTGETTFDSMLRVDGHLKGRVTSAEGTLIIGATGQVDADISVGSAQINGAVNGDIATSGKLTLGRSARVVGNISAARLIMEDGAVLEGNCSMVNAIEEAETVTEEPVETEYAIPEPAPDDTISDDFSSGIHLDISDGEEESEAFAGCCC